MTTVQVQPKQLISLAQNLRDHAKKLEIAMKNVEAAIKVLNDFSFSGNRANLLRGRYAATNSILMGAASLIIAFSTQLENIAALFVSADKKNTTGSTTSTGNSNCTASEQGDTSSTISVELKQGNYDDEMGVNRLKIFEVGCTITDVAVIARMFGKDVTPADVNKFLQQNNGYMPGTSKLDWNVAAKYLQPFTGGKGEFIDGNSNSIAKALNANQPVILHIQPSTPGGDGHWDLATSLGGDGNYSIIDPATGKTGTISVALKKIDRGKIYSQSTN